MKIISYIEQNNKLFEKSVITIGNFDGVHLGHGALFNKLKVRGDELGCKSVVVTFDPHPLSVLKPEKAPVLITTPHQKLELIQEYGVDATVVIPFTKQFSFMTADDFVRKILCQSLSMRHIIIGHDYAFGKCRVGNFETLKQLGRELNFTLEDIDPVGGNNLVYSSSLVRRYVLSGDMEGAADVLGRYHLISGVVVQGKHRGKGLGFPTANLDTQNRLIPPDGVYAVWATVNGCLEQGACNIGNNPTFGASERTIELFLLDYSSSLYGIEISIHFVKRLREERIFPDIETLKATLSSDVATARKILSMDDKRLIHPSYVKGYTDAKN